jgi:subtilisin
MADFNGASGGGASATCRSDVDDTNADFSNYTKPGSADDKHTIAAPGVCIKSTWTDGGYKAIGHAARRRRRGTLPPKRNLLRHRR